MESAVVVMAFDLNYLFFEKVLLFADIDEAGFYSCQLVVSICDV